MAGGPGLAWFAGMARSEGDVLRLLTVFIFAVLMACDPCEETVMKEVAISGVPGVRLVMSQRGCGATTGFVWVGRIGLNGGRVDSRVLFNHECHELKGVVETEPGVVTVTLGGCRTGVREEVARNGVRIVVRSAE